MSQYATVSELRAEGLPSAALSGITTDELNAALQSASGELDGYLRDRGALPLVSYSDPALRIHTIGIAAWRLLTRRGVNPEDPGHAWVRQRYEDALAWGYNVARGRITPDVTWASSGSSSGPQVSSYADEEPRGW